MKCLNIQMAANMANRCQERFSLSRHQIQIPIMELLINKLHPIILFQQAPRTQ